MTEDIALLGLGITSEPVVKATHDLRAFEQQADKTERSAKGLESTTALLAKAMGFLFFGTGLVLLVLIVYAMVSRLVH